MIIGASAFGADNIPSDSEGGCFQYHQIMRQRTSACAVIDAHREIVSVENRRPITTDQV